MFEYALHFKHRCYGIFHFIRTIPSVAESHRIKAFLFYGLPPIPAELFEKSSIKNFKYQNCYAVLQELIIVHFSLQTYEICLHI